MSDAAPIFVAGPDRSGTSLMYALLASHPNISMVRRSNMFRYFYRQFGDLKEHDNFEQCLGTMLRYKRLRHLMPDPDRIRREFWQGPPTYGRLFALFHAHHAERMGKSRWGDKSLHTERYADHVFAEFPAARIIHMVRDPRDRYASVYKRRDRNKGRVAATTARWLISERMALRNLERYPDSYKVVRYESLAFQPEQAMREVCAIIGEDFSPRMLTMAGAPDHGATGGNSSFGSIEPGTISTKAIGRFRQVLTQEEIAFIQFYAKQPMLAFEYALEPLQIPFSTQLSYWLIKWPVNSARMVGWMALEAVRDMKGHTIPAHRLAAPVSVPG